jgi:hypothetical protein
MSESPADIVKRYYYKCINIVDEVCYTEWKHEECRILREILFELTGDEKYRTYDRVWKSSNHINDILDNLIDEAENKE